MEVKIIKKDDQLCLEDEIEKVANEAEMGDVLEIKRIEKPSVFLLIVKGSSGQWSVVNMSSSMLWRTGQYSLLETLQEFLNTSTYNRNVISQLVLYKSKNIDLTITL